MTIWLTEENKHTIYSYCEMVLSKGVFIRELAQTNGIIVFSFKAVPHGQLWCRKSEKCNVKRYKGLHPQSSS